MRKQDINLGVVYAYRRSENHSPVPVIFLSTDLYTEAGRYESGPWKRAYAEDKPGTDYFGRTTGYPVVFAGADDATAEATIAAMQAVSLAEVLAGDAPSTVSPHIVTTLSRVKGQYAPVLAAYEAQKAAEKQRVAEAEERRRDRWQRGTRVAEVLGEHGIYAQWRGHLEISLDEAEKLAALLER
jgi:hypothetical protein